MQMSKRSPYITSIHLFLIIFCTLFFVLPFLLVIAVSFSNEVDVQSYGYKLIPMEFDLTAYKTVFANPEKITRSYLVTTFQAFTAMILGVLVMSLCGYAISRRNYKFRRAITFFIFFTLLFGGGLIPTYILVTQYLQLGNTVWVYIFPALCNAFYIIILRTFFQALPEEMIESAKVDGASEFRIFFQLIMPLSKPVLATIALFTLLARWNDWFTALIYIRDQDLYTLQFLLQRILMEAEFISNMAADLPAGMDINDFETPTETMRYAMAIVAAGPLLLVFPFFQKYFARGLTIGSVKG